MSECFLFILLQTLSYLPLLVAAIPNHNPLDIIMHVFQTYFHSSVRMVRSTFIDSTITSSTLRAFIFGFSKLLFFFALVFHIHFTWLLSICCFCRSLSLRFSIFLLLVVYSSCFFFGWCKKQPHNWIFVDDVIFVESDSIGNNFIGVNILLWMCY